LQRLDKQATERGLRNFLGGFGFHGDKTIEAVAPFSGGEKARLVLALLVYQKPNLLLLDEPTNHLDIEMRHALSSALQDFSGAMIIVSHDRHLLRTITDQFLLVADGKVTPFDGDLEDYSAWVKSQNSLSSKTSTANESSQTTNTSRKQQKKTQAENRQRQKSLRDRLKKAEKKIDQLNSKKSSLDAQLADNKLYEQDQREQLTNLLKDKKSLDDMLDAAEEAWLAAQGDIDAIEAL